MFKPNDVVLCINNKTHTGHGPVAGSIKEGSSYTIENLFPCNCSTRVTLKETNNAIWTSMNTCPKCSKAGIIGFYSWRFIKLAGDNVNTEEETCLDLPKQKTVQKNGLVNALKRLKEKVLT